MKVSELHVRLFKAFNYDFFRLHDEAQRSRPWDTYKDVDYPYVSVPLDPEITCIVGANESGKSQVLSALWYAIDGEFRGRPPSGRDACRYASFLGDEGELNIAQFGLTLTDLNADDLTAVTAAAADGAPITTDPVTEIHLFRVDPDTFELYINAAEESVVLDEAAAAGLLERLPAVFSIDTKRALPDSIPLDYVQDRIAGRKPSPLRRKARFELFDQALAGFETLLELAGQESVTGAQIKAALPASPPVDKTALDQFELAYDLLVTVGGIPPKLFDELYGALRDEEEGLKTAVIDKMNAQLSLGLNMPRWWSQDTEFDLRVDVQDYDLVFTIRDRTDARYMFGERSEGLKYFLSYLVQYLTRLKDPVPPRLLTMDEPDAYLSHQGQQDLLALFQDFITSSRTAQRQVVFVTHSPFLIDRNRAERVRVLHKGVEDEGTRVIKKAAHNHFEPLRSAFGGFVGELAFIGNCNLMLEGQVDAMYIAAMCSYAIGAGDEPHTFLDLNRVTLVHAGGTEHVPYMTYLARGRDHDQPAVIVLLDGDRPGHDAKDVLLAGFPKPGTKKRAPLVNPEFVTQINVAEYPTIGTDRTTDPEEIEDLIPTALLHRASIRLADDLCGDGSHGPSLDDVQQQLATGLGHYDALVAAFAASGSELTVTKFALARTFIQMLNDEEYDDTDLVVVRENFRVLFTKLRELQRLAEAERQADGTQKAVRRSIKTFLRHHADRATRNEVRLLLAEIGTLLDGEESHWSDKVELRRKDIERKLNLHKDLARDIDHYTKVKQQLQRLLNAADLPIDAADPDEAERIDDDPVADTEAVARSATESVAPEAMIAVGVDGQDQTTSS